MRDLVRRRPEMLGDGAPVAHGVAQPLLVDAMHLRGARKASPALDPEGWMTLADDGRGLSGDLRFWTAMGLDINLGDPHRRRTAPPYAMGLEDAAREPRRLLEGTLRDLGGGALGCAAHARGDLRYPLPEERIE